MSTSFLQLYRVPDVLPAILRRVPISPAQDKVHLPALRVRLLLMDRIVDPVPKLSSSGYVMPCLDIAIGYKIACY